MLRRTATALVYSGLALVAVALLGARGLAVAAEAGTPEVLAEDLPATPTPPVEESAEPPEDPSVAAGSEGDDATEVPWAPGDAAETTEPPAEEGQGTEGVRGVVQVLVMGAGDEIRRTASGFVVQANYVVTAAHVVEDEDHISVVVPSEGSPSPMLRASIGAVKRYADLALLVVAGLELEPLELAKDGFDIERNVFSTGFWSTAGSGSVTGVADTTGVVHEHYTLPPRRDDAAVGLLRHNAMIPATGYGGPLLNDCHQVVGVNRGSPTAPRRALRRGQAPQDVVYAAGVNAIIGLLQSAGVTFIQTESSCPTREAAARAQAERATEERRRAEENAARATEEKEEMAAELTNREAELSQQQEQLDTLQAQEAEQRRQIEELERIGANAEAEKAALKETLRDQEAARQRAEGLEGEVLALQRDKERIENQVKAGRQNLVVTIVIAVAALLLLAAIGGVFYRRRSFQLAYVRQQAVAGQQLAPDGGARLGEAGGVSSPGYLLTGATGDGNTVSLEVSDSMVASGVVIGRSPRNALLLIDDKTLSREHARLFDGPDGGLSVEDLDTTNGTRVNGRQLEPGRVVPLRSGDTLQLGRVTLRLTRTG